MRYGVADQHGPGVAVPDLQGEAAQERLDLLVATEESIARMLREAGAPTSSDTLDHVLFGALALTLKDCVETFARRIADVELPDVTEG